MASLTGTKIKDTYDGLLKTTDNGALGASAKQLTDGLGTASPLYLSTTGFGIGATPNTSYKASIYAPFASGLNGLYIEAGEFNKSPLIINHTNASVSANLMEVQKSGSGVFTIDSSGRVGIGVSPSYQLHNTGSFGFATDITGNIGVFGSNTATADTYFRLQNSAGAYDVGTSSTGHYLYGQGSLPLQFFTNSTERMRITSGGYLKASNDGTYVGSAGAYHEMRQDNGSATIGVFSHSHASTPYGMSFRFPNADPNNSTQYFLQCEATGSVVRCQIDSNGNLRNSNNSYGAISDIKHKENIEDATPKLDDLMKVKIRNFNMIGETNKQIGVVAQELETVFPSMIDESADFEEREVELKDEDGNIVYKTEQVLVSEAVEAVIEIVEHEAIAEELDADGNVIVEAQDAWTEEVIVTPAQEAVYETIVTDEPVMTTEKFDLGTTTKSVKYSVFVPMLIKAVQELNAKVESLEAQLNA